MEFTGHPPRPTGVRRALFRLPRWLYRAHLGFLLGHRFVLIDHVGRRTGLPRQAVVEVVARDRGTGAVTVASGFGPRSDWYRNLLAQPDVTVQLAGRTLTVRAVAMDEDEAAEAMADYARSHRYAARRLAAFMGFRVDGSLADYRAAGRLIPMVRFEQAADSALDRQRRIYRAWGRLPALYAAQDWVTFLGRPHRIRAAAVAALELAPGSTVVEVGCGTGRNLAHLHERVGRGGCVVGVDYSGPVLAAARRLARRRGWSEVGLVRADAAALPVGSSRVDGVLAVLALSAVPDHRAALLRSREALRPGGRIVVCDARPFPGPLLGRLNPLVRRVYGPLAGWHPDRDLVADLREVFGEVSVQELNRGTFFVATAHRPVPSGR